MSDPRAKVVGMTYAELKAALEAFTPDQLSAEVVWSGDERGGKVLRVWIAEEDWILNDDGDECEPRSVVATHDPEVAKNGRVIIAKGTPHLVVDP